MASILTEVRQSARRLLASSGYSAAVLATLSLGLALSVGMFTVLNGIVLSGLPYPDSARIVEFETVNTAQDQNKGALTGAEAVALADAEAFEHAAWYIWGGETVLSGGRPREITTEYVSEGFFPTFGMPAQAGRWLGAGEFGPDASAVVLSDLEWQRLANRDPAIIGRQIELASGTVTVVGVMPPEFAYPSASVGMWRAIDMDWYRRDPAGPAAFATSRHLMGVGKLAAGVDAGRAMRALDALSARVREAHGLPDDGWRIRFKSLLDITIGDVRGVLAGVFVVSLVVLAIACANVGALLAGRLAARERELAVFQALGATAGRVWRGVLFELVMLTALASVIAMLVLTVGLDAFRETAAGILPRADDIELDPGVFGFAVLLGLTCPLLVAVPFAVRLRQRMSGNLRAGNKGSATATGALRLLPVAGLALATAALIAGSAVALSLDRLKSVDPGFAARELFAVQAYHQGGPDEWRRFAREVSARIAAEPDVAGVAVTTISPLAPGGRYWIDAQLPGHDRPEAWLTVLQRVSPGYLDVVGQSLLSGRAFLPTDGASAAKVAIVNETFARRAFGTTDVVGRRIALALRDGAREDFAIVGVSADIRNATLREAADPEVLVQSVQVPWIGMTFLARAPRAGADLLERMQNAVWAVDPREAITRATAIADDLDAQLAQTVFFTRMLGGFAVLAVLLAAFGTYSVVAFLQRRRTREIGVRLALGAEPLTVARHVLLQGFVLAACAGVSGSLLAIGVLRLLAGELFGVDAASPALYALGVGGALLAATAASVTPAWRAARVQPMTALRDE